MFTPIFPFGRLVLPVEHATSIASWFCRLRGIIVRSWPHVDSRKIYLENVVLPCPLSSVQRFIMPSSWSIDSNVSITNFNSLEVSLVKLSQDNIDKTLFLCVTLILCHIMISTYWFFLNYRFFPQ